MSAISNGSMTDSADRMRRRDGSISMRGALNSGRMCSLLRGPSRKPGGRATPGVPKSSNGCIGPGTGPLLYCCMIFLLCDRGHAAFLHQPHVVLHPFPHRHALLLGQAPHLRRDGEGAVGVAQCAAAIGAGAARDRSCHRRRTTASWLGCTIAAEEALDELEVGRGIDGVAGVERAVVGVDRLALE